ncbi:hypothetical protein ABPG72_014033, partial [Tetrahymena utriculariae]
MAEYNKMFNRVLQIVATTVIQHPVKECHLVLNIQFIISQQKHLVSNSKSKSKPKLVNQLPINPKTVQKTKQRLSFQPNCLIDIHSQDELANTILQKSRLVKPKLVNQLPSNPKTIQKELEEIGQDNQNEENQENLLLVLEIETFMLDLAFDSAISQSKIYDKSKKGNEDYFGPESEKRFSRILELDNLIILYGWWIQQDITEIYQDKGILIKFKDQINRKFNIFQIAEINILSKCQQRKIIDLIQLLMSKQQNKPNFMIYSAILPDILTEQVKIFSQYNQKKQANQSIHLGKNELIQLFEQLLNNKDYYKSLEIILSDRFQCSLKQNLQRQRINTEISEYDKLQIFHQIIGSISYLDSFNVINNNLNPDCFLISIKDNKIAIILGDFVISFQLNGNLLPIETLIFQAPELVNNDKNKVYSKKIKNHALTLIVQNCRIFTLDH